MKKWLAIALLLVWLFKRARHTEQIGYTKGSGEVSSTSKFMPFVQQNSLRYS